MYDAGKLEICELTNTAAAGRMPTEQLVKICDAYYDNQTIGVTRWGAALGAKQRIDRLVRVYHTDLPVNAEYAVIDDEQYRISLKQPQGDHILLTLERLEEMLDVLDE